MVQDTLSKEEIEVLVRSLTIVYPPERIKALLDSGYDVHWLEKVIKKQREKYGTGHSR